MGYWAVGAGHVRPGCGWCAGGYGWCPGGYGKAAGRACPAPTGRQFLQRAVSSMPHGGVKTPPYSTSFQRALLGYWAVAGRRAVLGRPVKAPPGIAALAHRSPSGATRHLPRIGGVCPERGGFLAGKARAKRRPFQGSWPREARPEGLCPFAATAHFAHSAGASVASGCGVSSGTGVSSGWGAFASRYA